MRIIHWSAFAVALVDGTLGETFQDKHGPHGWNILPGIVAAGVLCIATSTSIPTNTRMTNLGAHRATHCKIYSNFEQILNDLLRELQLLPAA